MSLRILWSLPLCFVIMTFRRQIGEYLSALKDWRVLRLLLASSLLIALNWNKPFGKGFAVTVLFDGACCVIYGLYLVGLA